MKTWNKKQKSKIFACYKIVINSFKHSLEVQYRTALFLTFSCAATSSLFFNSFITCSVRESPSDLSNSFIFDTYMILNYDLTATSLCHRTRFTVCDLSLSKHSAWQVFYNCKLKYCTHWPFFWRWQNVHNRIKHRRLLSGPRNYIPLESKSLWKNSEIFAEWYQF